MPKPIITRFAPSPTGALHIGGARTALFAWAFARKHGGQFILRVEDTDQRRSSKDSAAGILRDLQWLGIDWDQGPMAAEGDLGGYDHQAGENGPYFQSQRLDIYDRHIEALLKADFAYEDGGAVRFRMGQDITHDDAVFGSISVAGKDLEDFVIKKADGFPTFHLAVVVDDALMGVTHVLRGQEHLPNTPKHAALLDALAKVMPEAEKYTRPVWAHMPSIMNPGGSKMSKRDKAKVAREAAQKVGLAPGGVEGIEAVLFASFMKKETDDKGLAEIIASHLGVPLPEIEVLDFKNSGYLPSTILNYIALLGWNPKTEVERFDLPEFIERFTLEGIHKSNSTFDREKLFRFNAERIAALTPAAFSTQTAQLAPLEFAPLLTSSEKWHLFCKAYQPRARTLTEPFRLGRFFVVAPAYVFTDKPVAKAGFGPDGFAPGLLAQLQEALTALPAQGFGKATHDWIAAKAEADPTVGMGKWAGALRVAVSGSTTTPDLEITLDLLGRTETLERLAACLAATGK